MATAKLLKQSTVYVLLGFLAPAVNFLLLPVYAHYLLPADYGIITLATLVQAVLTNLIGLGANGAFSRLYYDCRGKQSAVGALFCGAFLVFILSFAVILLLGAVSGGFVFRHSFKNDVFTFSRYGYIIMLSSLSANLQLIVLGLLRNQERVREYARWAIAFFLLSASGIFIGVVGLRWGAYGSVLGRAVGSTLPVICFYILYFLRHRFILRPYLLRRLLHYGMPLVPYLLLNVAFANIDKLFVERYFDMTVLGQYGFAIQIASVIDIFITAVQSATYPQLFRELKQQGNTGGANKLIRQIFSGALLTSFMVNAAIVSIGTLLIYWFINPRYHAALSYLPLLCMAYIPRALWTVWGVALMFRGKTKVLPLMNFIALSIGLGVNFLLVPRIGIYALPLSLFLCQLTMVVLSMYFSRKFGILIPETRKLTREHLMAGALLVLTVALTWLYNTSIPNVLIYTPALLTIMALTAVLFKQQLQAGVQTLKARLLKSR